MKSPYEIILLPRITERAVKLSESGKYTFVVAHNASKAEIARAIEQHYKKEHIKVEAVNTMHVRGKLKRVARFRRTGFSPKWKKAIVTLAKGQTLPDFGV